MTYNHGLHLSCMYPRTNNEAVESEYEQWKPTHLATFLVTQHSSNLRRRLAKAVADDARIKMTIVDQKFHTHTTYQKPNYLKDILCNQYFVRAVGRLQPLGCLKQWLWDVARLSYRMTRQKQKAWTGTHVQSELLKEIRQIYRSIFPRGYMTSHSCPEMHMLFTGRYLQPTGASIIF